MIMRWCNVQTNQKDLQAVTYPTICTHHKLHNNDDNKIPAFPECICNTWQVLGLRLQPLLVKWFSHEDQSIPVDDNSTLDQVMTLYCQAKSHYLNQCWPKSVSPYGVTILISKWPKTKSFSRPSNLDVYKFQLICPKAIEIAAVTILWQSLLQN